MTPKVRLDSHSEIVSFRDRHDFVGGNHEIGGGR